MLGEIVMAKMANGTEWIIGLLQNDSSYYKRIYKEYPPISNGFWIKTGKCTGVYIDQSTVTLATPLERAIYETED